MHVQVLAKLKAWLGRQLGWAGGRAAGGALPLALLAPHLLAQPEGVHLAVDGLAHALRLGVLGAHQRVVVQRLVRGQPARRGAGGAGIGLGADGRGSERALDRAPRRYNSK
jgi:hypothetical protein